MVFIPGIGPVTPIRGVISFCVLVTLTVKFVTPDMIVVNFLKSSGAVAVVDAAALPVDVV